MSSINQGMTINTQGLWQSQVMSSQAQHAIGNQKYDPQQKDNYSTTAVTLTQESQAQQNANIFSRNRYQALAAYKAFGQTQQTTAAQNNNAQESTLTQQDPTVDQQATATDKTEDPDRTKSDGTENDKKQNGEIMTDEEQKQVDELESRDQEVKTHEQAHMSAGGELASGPYYDYQNGADGKRYAIGGHVNIDTSEESTPSKTIEKMQRVISAANAPAEPSSQDRQVAAQAQRTLSEARMEQSEQNKTKSQGSSEQEDISTQKANNTASTSSSKMGE